MRDVAEKAGVSIKTVSRVVNKQGEISEETRRRVLQTIEALGYRPSLVARALVTQHSCTIGLVMADISNPFFPEVARGVLDRAQQAEYNVFLCNTGGNLQQELQTLESLADHGVDGIIIIPSYDSAQNLRTFVKTFQPLVLVNYQFEHPGVSQIIVNNEQGAKLAVDYLVDKGHQKIGMLSGVQNPSSNRVRRILGYRQAMKHHGLAIADDWIVPTRDSTVECGHESTHRLLSKHPEITAVFAYNDLLAIGALKACQELGRDVPDDCAIIGFDDTHLATIVNPTLTSVRVDKYNLGYQAMNQLLTMLQTPSESSSPIHLDVELTIRQSA